MKKLLALTVAIMLLSLTPNQEKKYHVTLTLEQWNGVIGGLQSSDLSSRISNQLIQDISKQVQAQLQDTVKPKK